MMIVEGIIRTKTKIHVTSALDASTKINADGQIGTEDARIPLSRTYRTVAFTPNGGRVEVPFFPGNSIVGRMRRAVTSMIAESLRSRGEQISRTTYRGISCGAADPKPEMLGLNVDEYAAYLKDPHIGIFGGGKRLYEGGFKMFDMVPITQATIEAGMVPEDFIEHMAMLSTGEEGRPATRVTGIDVLHRRDDLIDGVGEEIIQTISDFDGLSADMKQEAVRKAQAAAKRAGVKTEEDTPAVGRISMSQQSAREYIVPGIAMYFKAALRKRVTKAQLGVWVLGLQTVLNDNEFGGVSHLGYGEMNLADAATNLTLHGDEVSGPLFSLVRKGGKDQLEVCHPEALEAVREAQAWIASVTNESFESFYTASVPESSGDEKKAKGKGKEKAEAPGEKEGAQ